MLQPAPPARQRSRSDRGHDVLPAAAAPREVDVRLPRARLRRRLRRLRDRRRTRTRASATSCAAAAAPRAATSPSPTRASRCRRTRRARRRSATSRPRSRRTARPTRRSSLLNRYLALGPKDDGRAAASSPASTSAARTRSQRDAQEAQVRASYLTVRLDLQPRRSTSATGRRSGPTRSTQAVSTQANAGGHQGVHGGADAFQKAEETYERLAAVAPNDPNVQLELAQAAQQAATRRRRSRRTRSSSSSRPTTRARRSSSSRSRS